MCRVCIDKATARYQLNAPENRAYRNARHAEERRKILAAYAIDGIPQCACCHEKELKFLQLDHIHNNGAQHRKDTKSRQHGVGKIYRDIARLGFPDDYQLLCANCNIGKHLNGGICPHQVK